MMCGIAERTRREAPHGCQEDRQLRHRLLLAAALGLALLVVAVPTVAAASGDRAAGFGVRAPSCQDSCEVGSFAFDARSGPNGENAQGWFSVNFEGYASFTGKVTCLNVSGGHWATLFGQITSGTGAADPTTYTQTQDPLYFVVVVHGQGRPHHRFPGPDQMSFVGWDTEANFLTLNNIALADICGNPFQALNNDNTMFKLVAGDIRVKNR